MKLGVICRVQRAEKNILRKTNMTMKANPFEDVLAIKNGDLIFLCYVSVPGNSCVGNRQPS